MRDSHDLIEIDGNREYDSTSLALHVVYSVFRASSNTYGDTEYGVPTYVLLFKLFNLQARGK
jgi:hypothetical protein